MTYLKRFLKKIIIFIAKFLATLFILNLSKKKIIIFQCYDENRYCDNSTYLFEYLSKLDIFDVYWTTEKKEIRKYLEIRKLKYVSIKSNFIKYIYVFANAKCIINPGTNYFDFFEIISSKVVKISISHGMGPKLTITKTDDIYNSNREISEINRFDYINFTTDFVALNSGVNIFKIPKKKILKLGFPRCDDFFDKKIREQNYLIKNIGCKILNDIDIKKSKIIYYTPTWRPYDYEFPLNKMENFDYIKFDKFLSENKIYFFYTLHSERIFSNIPKNLNRIIKIDTKKYPLFDSNKFMMETDILINDYSTTTTDYCILKKPQIFFMPDYKYYNQIKGFLENYKKIIPGDEVQNFADFKKLILNLLENPEIYNIKFKDKIQIYLKKYYDTNVTNSKKEFTKFLKKIFI